MKLTKSKLERIIQEELEEVMGAPPEILEIKELLAGAHSLYKKLPNELKHYMIENFEMYAQRWREEAQGTKETPEYETN